MVQFKKYFFLNEAKRKINTKRDKMSTAGLRDNSSKAIGLRVMNQLQKTNKRKKLKIKVIFR
jgi:hypothetical protein